MTRNRRLLLIQLLLTALSLGAVIWWASKQQAPEIPTSLGALLALLGALLLYGIVTMARAERWERILRLSDVKASRADAYALVPVGYMGNNVLPARGGELLRTYLLGRSAETSKRTVLGTILGERVLDAVALGVILVALAYDLLQKVDWPSTSTLLIIGGGVLAGVVALAAVLWHLRARLERARLALVPLVRPLRTLWSRQGIALLAFSLVLWLIEAGVYLIVGLAVHVHLGLQGALAVVAFTNAAALIPAAPGYIGTFDAAVLFAVGAVTTVASHVALSYLLLLRFILFVPITIAGLVVLVVRYGGLSRLRAARRETVEPAI